MIHEVSKSLDNMKGIYPDLVLAGGLNNALQIELKQIGSKLTVTGLEDSPEDFLVYARVETHHRFSQIYMAAEYRMFSFDFWRNGVCLANGTTDNIGLLAEVLEFWNNSICSTKELSKKYKFVSPNEEAEVFEEGREVEVRWESLMEWIPKEFPELTEFLNEAYSNEKLRMLFPFTSLNRFCFSRCTGFPYSYDIPIVSPLDNGMYEVISETGELIEVIGKGGAKEAVDMVIKSLPSNCGPALPGTANDFGLT